MKNTVLLVHLFIFLQFTAVSQVIISTDNSLPDNSAMLEIKSTSKGMLLPRMTTTEMNTISSPAAGLMVYNKTLRVPVYFDGISWKLFTTIDGESCGHVTYGGQTYTTVVIGMQCWMKQNLNIGTPISSTTEQTDNQIIEKYCFGDLITNCDEYGGLYQWGELMNYTTSSSSIPSGRQGICPSGWHLPSHGEWAELISYLGGSDVAGGKMKQAGYAHWNSPNTGATNSSGFTAYGGGYWSVSMSGFMALNYNGMFWSSTESSSTNSLYRMLDFLYESVTFPNSDKEAGFSARCIKD